jgi:(p)ppGpp synthase/HD superfamily hydrolase
VGNLVLAAARYAEAAHRGQWRKHSGQPYIVHPMRVAGRITLEAWADEADVAAAWLHDTMEDCGVTEEDLRRKFPARTVELVKALTSPSKGSAEPREARKRQDREHLRGAAWQARAIKLADRADNLRDLLPVDHAEFERTYLGESVLLLEVLRGLPVETSLVAEYVEVSRLLAAKHGMALDLSG